MSDQRPIIDYVTPPKRRNVTALRVVGGSIAILVALVSLGAMVLGAVSSILLLSEPPNDGGVRLFDSFAIALLGFGIFYVAVQVIVQAFNPHASEQTETTSDNYKS